MASELLVALSLRRGRILLP